LPALTPFRRPSRCLLVQARDDPDAFAAFYDAYAERVLVFFMRRVLDAEVAFDLMSETFAKALERRDQFRGRSVEEEQGWLFAIARSEASHYWRHGRVERRALDRMAVPVPPLEDEHIERIEDMAVISELVTELGDALTQLPEAQRRAVELRVVGELGYDELADRLGVSQQVARARVSRGLRALARALEPREHRLEEIA
jgi:RNA polymerase sigma factor (sigma-70 family)